MRGVRMFGRLPGASGGRAGQLLDVVRVSSLVRVVRNAVNPLAMRVPRIFARAFLVIFASILRLSCALRAAWL